MIHLINRSAEAWFPYMASATLQATFLALVVLGILWIGRGWSPALRYAFMMLALCKFVIPPMLSLPTGLLNRMQPQQWAESAPPLRYVAPVAQSVLSPVGNVQPRGIPALSQASPTKPSLTANGRLLLLHLSGAFLILAVAAAQKIRLVRLASRATTAQAPALTETYDALCRSMNLIRKPRLLISSDNQAPITFGAWKPVVMLPQALVAALPLPEIRVILGHELAHNRRRDPWIAWLQVVVSAIWWFNPVYWLLSRSIRGVREDCCDDMVLATGLASREVYCRTLLKAARAALEDKAVTRAAFAYLGKSLPLRRRLKRIMSARFIRTPKLALAGMLMIMALALVLLPGVEPRILAQNAIPSEAHAWNTNFAPLETFAVLQNSDKASKAESRLQDESRYVDQPQTKLPREPQNKDVSNSDTQTDANFMQSPIRDQRLKAQQAFRELLQRYPDSQDAPRVQRYSKEDIDENLALGDFKVGQFYASKGNYAKAKLRFMTIIDKYPNFSRIEEVHQLFEALSTANQRSQSSQENAISDYYRKWLNEDVVYITTQEERNAFLALRNDQGRDFFIERFWARRNPNPRQADNAYKEEHYRRIAYANRHFASSVPGWKTDRGRIYIMYGKPDEIESHPAGGAYTRPINEGGGTTTTYAFEKWRYRHIDGVGDDIEIEFVDPSGTSEYHMAMSPDEKITPKF